MELPGGTWSIHIGINFNAFTLDPFITTKLDIISAIHAESKKVIFCWVPSHFVIIGYELTDSEAMAALN